MTLERIAELRGLMAKATPGERRVRVHPTDPNEFHVSAPCPKGHPYHGRTTEMEVLSEEDYPTKRADAEAHVALHNAAPALLDAAEEGVKLREALEMYFHRGHHDTCAHALSEEYDCNCGHDKARAALREKGGET